MYFCISIYKYVLCIIFKLGMEASRLFLHDLLVKELAKFLKSSLAAEWKQNAQAIYLEILFSAIV